MEKFLLCEAKASKRKDAGIMTFAMTTKDVDRDGDIIEPKGVQLNHFLSNPVFLWAHDHRRPPIGRVIPESIMVSDNAVYADVKFDLNDPFAKLVYEKYKAGFLNAGSIRFRPLEYEPRRETQTDDNGEEKVVEVGGWHIKKWELLEFSAVPIPANPMALVQKEEYDPVELEIQNTLKAVQVESEDFQEVAAEWVKSFEADEPEEQETITITYDLTDEETQKTIDALIDRVTKLEVVIDELISRIDERHVPTGAHGEGVADQDSAAPSTDDEPEESKSVVPFRATPKADEGKPWDKRAALARVRRWASSDGSGAKDKINWNKYRQAFAWYDSSDPENFGSYKLPHHDVMDGNLVVVWSGVRAAMAALMGARGGVQIPDSDRRGVYNHLSRHYRQFDKEPPEFKEVEFLENPEEMMADLILNNDEFQEKLINRVMEMLNNEGDANER